MSKIAKHSQKDIIIVGAGAVGLVTAMLLAQKGFDVCLIEKGNPSKKIPKTLENGHTTALMTASINVLKETGIWDKLVPWTEELRILRIFDPEKDKEQQIDFTAREIGKQNFGLNVPQSILRAILLKEIKTYKNIDYRPETDITDINMQPFKALIKTKAGEEITGSLLIAADGRRSFCREHVGINVDQKDYNQTALTFVVSHRLDHEKVSTEIYKKGGPLTFVPLPGGKQSSVVWVNNTDRAEQLLSLKKQELLKVLQTESQNILGDLTVETAIQSWPLNTLKAKALYNDRLVLIGEAAHGFSPVGAQGLNLSFRDIGSLVHLVHCHAKTGQDIGSETLLKSYEKDRKEDTSLRFYGVDFLNQLIKSDNIFEKRIRQFGLDTVSNILPLKHFLMKKGMKQDVKKTA